MSFPLKLSSHRFSLLPHLGLNELPYKAISRVSTPFHFGKLRSSSVNQNLHLRLCSISGDGSGLYDMVNEFSTPLDDDLSNAQNCSPNHKGSVENNESSHGQPPTSNKMLKRLRRYGISGILSYGLLNTVYYLTTFLLVWFYVAPAPGRMGYLAAVERFLKVMAMVWAGSQVTKLARAGGAVALAPFVDTGLSWFTVRFNFKSQGKAFTAIVGFCFGLAIVLFLVITLLWA